MPSEHAHVSHFASVSLRIVFMLATNRVSYFFQKEAALAIFDMLAVPFEQKGLQWVVFHSVCGLVAAAIELFATCHFGFSDGRSRRGV